MKRLIAIGGITVVLVLSAIAGALVGDDRLPRRLGLYFDRLLHAVLQVLPDRSVADPAMVDASCLCPRRSDTCPCQSISRYPSYDFDFWKQLDGLFPAHGLGNSPGFEDRFRAATGYDRIRPTVAEGGGRISFRQKARYLHGELREMIVAYERPLARVRALYAINPDFAKDLLILTPGSWTTSERMLGIGPEDYLRQIGKYYFERGTDVLAFDHGSNGTIESILNVRALLEGGQILGVWARSICDTLSGLELRKRYMRIWLYGLSRGGRVVEYTAISCPGFHFAVVEDLYSPDGFQEYFWAGPSATGNLKYGAWFGHLVPLVGHAAIADFMSAMKSPVIYTSARKNFDDSRDRLEMSFRWEEGLTGEAPIKLVFKSDIGHKPELALLDQMLAGRWSDIQGISLWPGTRLAGK